MTIGLHRQPRARSAPVTTSRPSFTIMYHSVEDDAHDPYQVCVSPERFRRHMRLLSRRGLRGVAMRELVEAHRSGTGAGRVCLAFDDGYRTVVDMAAPIRRVVGSPPLSSWSANSSAARMCGISPDVHDLCWILATWPTSLSVVLRSVRTGRAISHCAGVTSRFWTLRSWAAENIWARSPQLTDFVTPTATWTPPAWPPWPRPDTTTRVR